MIMSGRGSEASILITQPRRISAIAVSARVGEERIDDGSVGYTIRGETKRGKDTKLLFCTTGVVLRRLSTGDSLQDVSHIIVDEVRLQSTLHLCSKTYAYRFMSVLWMGISFCSNSKN